MSALQAELDQIKAGFEKKVPAEIREVMHRSTHDLQNSGILDGVTGVGAQAPAWSLEDSEGNTHSLADALAKGRLVLSFYRGLW